MPFFLLNGRSDGPVEKSDMSEIEFQCPRCRQDLSAGQDMEGLVVQCPLCELDVAVPQATAHEAPSGPPPLPKHPEGAAKQPGVGSEASTEIPKAASLGRRYVNIGWVLNTINAGFLLTRWVNPYVRQSSTDMLLNSPSVTAFNCTLAFLVGSNIMAVLAFVCGAYAHLRCKNRAGVYVLVCAAVIFIGAAIREFMPS